MLLNGNANDYSGDGNNGQATEVTYTSNWYSGYTPITLLPSQNLES